MTSTLTGRDIGRANLATRAILDRYLREADLSFEQWMTLFTLDGGPSPAPADALATTLGEGLHIDAATTRATISEMLTSGLLVAAGDTPGVAISVAGEAVFRPVKDAVDRLAVELYGDLAPDDLAATKRTLDEITRRANARLATIS